MAEPISPLDTLRSMVEISAEDECVPVAQAFTGQSMALLEEAGELNGPERFGAPVGRIDALDWDADTGRLTVIVTDFAHSRWGDVRERLELLPVVNEAVAQITRLITASRRGAVAGAERILSYLGDVSKDIRAIRLIAVSNGSYEVQQGTLGDVADAPAELAIWDAGDLATAIQHTAARQQTADFRDQPEGGIRILGPIGERDLSSYLMVLPGDLIADLYQAHGASILGRNIRAFLQVSNRVNKGIRQSLKETPSSFFAFNNGLSLTATTLKRAIVGGQPVVTEITGLEIVNGGQTTASLHNAKYHDGVSLANVWVQAKLTVLPAVDSDDMALQIARFANSQSPVRMGDLTSNNRFFQSIEQLSRTVDFSEDKTGRLWFFERTRGQFATEAAAARGLGAEARFKRKYERARRFDKAALAKFELAWLQMPHVVAAGAEKSLAIFMNLEHGPGSAGVADEKYYRRLVAKAVLWAETDKIIGALDLGGYKAVDVGYTMALISNRTAGRLDLDAVAQRQDSGEAWRTAVTSLAPTIHENLIRNAGARNVSSWSKTAAAWSAVQDIDWTPDATLTSYRPAADETRVTVAVGQSAIGLAASHEDVEARERVEEYGSQAWFQLSSWAKETDNLQGWQRGIAFSLGRMLASNKTPTAKQVTQAVKILDEASRLGFVPKRG
ncbi:AIPR family protein [Microbacterium aquimaris]|uniref:AIPR family protein n=1 Tax=Microbacterium aquimaris TaxID=459816 RepID=UPI002AD380D1|nr:AIPR family protein [Microbacterium aquimaris]MDZ8275707.1 AIPR family protein [Microbacterium aquimaris]